MQKRYLRCMIYPASGVVARADHIGAVGVRPSVRPAADGGLFHAHGDTGLGQERPDRGDAPDHRPVRPSRSAVRGGVCRLSRLGLSRSTAREAAERLKAENGLTLIDPVMGDNGEVYSSYTPEMCTRMRELCAIADLITPNTTEAAILLGRDPASLRRSPSVRRRRVDARAL